MFIHDFPKKVFGKLLSYRNQSFMLFLLMFILKSYGFPYACVSFGLERKVFSSRHRFHPSGIACFYLDGVHMISRGLVMRILVPCMIL